jgi:hypothetical protein
LVDALIPCTEDEMTIDTIKKENCIEINSDVYETYDGWKS